MQDNVYKPSRADIASPGEKSFDFSRAMNETMETFKTQWGLGLGIMVLLAFAILILIIPLYALMFFAMIGIGTGEGLPDVPVEMMMGGAGLIYLVLMIASLFIGGPIYASLPILGLEMFRGRARVGNLFAGFKRYWPTLGAVLIQYSLIMLPMIPFILMYIAAFASMFTELDKTNADSGPPVMFFILYFGAMFGILLVQVVVLWIQGRLMPYFPLVIEKGLGPIEAFRESWRMTARPQWWLLLIAFLAATVIPMIGAMACYVGMLITVPFAWMLQGSTIAQLFGEQHPTYRPPGSASATSSAGTSMPTGGSDGNSQFNTGPRSPYSSDPQNPNTPPDAGNPYG